MNRIDLAQNRDWWLTCKCGNEHSSFIEYREFLD